MIYKHSRIMFNLYVLFVNVNFPQKIAVNVNILFITY